MAPPSGPALVVGCGYLGGRVAAAWRAQGRTVYALTRGRGDELRAAGLTPIVGDVTDPASLAGVRDLPPLSTVLYAVGLDRGAGKSMREVYVEGVKNVAAALPQVARWLHVSSTSVYGQTGGEVVTETSPTEPREESGKVVLDTERALHAARPDAIILRFAGIYGPGRVLRRAALLKGEPYTPDPDKWLNLIHVADGVAAVLAAEFHGTDGRIYNISDETPVTRRDFYTETAKVLGAPPAAFEPPATPADEANRRLSTEMARTVLGFTPRYPSYREGLAASV
jgi:nucleoside-diphosphate-sugar epimerase